jgi:hypothetical protein
VHTGFRWGNLRERDLWEYPGIDEKIILKWIFRMWDGRAWTGLIWHALVIVVMNLQVP